MIIGCDNCQTHLDRLAPRTSYMTPEGAILLCAACVAEAEDKVQSWKSKFSAGVREAARRMRQSRENKKLKTRRRRKVELV